MNNPLSERFTNITPEIDAELNEIAHITTEEGCYVHSFRYSPGWYGWLCRYCDMAIPREGLEEILEDFHE